VKGLGRRRARAAEDLKKTSGFVHFVVRLDAFLPAPGPTIPGENLNILAGGEQFLNILYTSH